MKKILILGIVASGKTTLAKEISQKINIPWYELDTIVHHETPHGRNKRTPDEQIAVIQDIDRHGAWIFEGTDRHLTVAYGTWQIGLSFWIHPCGKEKRESYCDLSNKISELKRVITQLMYRC